MIRTLTIIEEKDKKGNTGANGSLPMDGAARAMIIIAYMAKPALAGPGVDSI